ncbi:phage antirepressor protein [Weissella oryzae SG25]|uniref:Phage antirepressor protein n=1 Tax=Weissella oryzae (strain DSM 25784 / JCM 18191 / LMG 30913 / SG25) TaxID=1329250 RepID=A0A069CXQ1_WEIOS|nr:phage antirepressor KilAC domain-containing protein [Weissella oryzae]GAK32033.1 phage antirepressor protein [Weissella oryzae SG25]
MSDELKVIGRENVGGYEFTGIEGGFGQGKRGMLVRDIAEIHERTAREINQDIERNRNRFKNGTEIVDLKHSEFQVTLSDLKFTAKQVANSKHIYMLSERGYAKLLKILEDDKAWEIYDLFVDEYFNMRAAVKQPKFNVPQTFPEALRLAADLSDEIEEMKPKVAFADAVTNSDDAIQVAALAKLMKQNGINTGQKRLFSWLRDNEYLKKQHGSEWNKPTQKSMNLELFKVVEKTKELPDGVVELTSTTLVTGKGQQYFINKFLGHRGQLRLEI